MIKIRKKAIAGISLSLTLFGCGGNQNSTPSPDNQFKNAPITIDNAGIIPILNGASSTNAAIYIHNNRGYEIKDISYTGISNNSTKLELSANKNDFILNVKKILGLNISNDLVNQASAGLCKNIPAYGTCSLSFRTPQMDLTDAQKSMILSANYVDNGKKYNFQQLINIKQINSQKEEGVKFASGVNLTDNNQYGVIYAYGANNNKNYTIKSLKTDNKSFAVISDGNITSKEVSSGMIQPIEVRSNLASELSHQKVNTSLSFASTGISVISNDGVKDYLNSTTINATPVASGAILTIGYIPYVNTGSENPTTNVTIYNAGNLAANSINVVTPSGVSINTNTCNGSLNPAQSCSLNLSFPSSSSGSDILKVDYMGNTLTEISSNLQWFNPSGGTILNIAYNPNPISFNATNPQPVSVTINNLESNFLNNIVTTQTSSSNAKITSPIAISCSNSASISTGTNMVSGGSCTFGFTINDDIPETGNIMLTISGNQPSGVYSRKFAIPFTANSFAPNIVITPGNTFNFIGDNKSTAEQTFTVTNTGIAPANLTNNPTLFGSAASFSNVTNNSCTNGFILNSASGNSCSFTVTVGPEANPTASTINQVLIESIQYSSAQTGITEVTNTNQVQVAPNTNTTLTLFDQNATGDESGDGRSIGSPWVFNGASNEQSITLNYINSSASNNPIHITGVSSNSPLWNLIKNPSPSVLNCFESDGRGATLNYMQDCSLTFGNMANYYASQGVFVGGSSNMNITFNIPTVTYVDEVVGSQYSESTPIATTGLSVVPAQSNFATLTMNYSLSSTANQYVLSYTLANLGTSNYGTINTSALLDNYYSAFINVTGGCSNPTLNNSYYKQVCALSSSALNGSTTFVYDNNLYSNVTLTAGIALPGYNYGVILNSNYLTVTAP